MMRLEKGAGLERFQGPEVQGSGFWVQRLDCTAIKRIQTLTLNGEP